MTHGINRMLYTFSLACAMTLGGPAQAALLNSYDFDNGLTDTLGVGNALVASGGTLTNGRYDFDLNQGLQLTDALADTSNYGIEMRFRVDDNTAGYNKLIDFDELGSDQGLYIFNGALRYFTATNTFGDIAVGNDVTVGLERQNDNLRIYLNGALVGSSFQTTTQGLSASNVLNFFEDDNVTGQGEAFVGSVDFLRIHDDASTFGTGPAITPPMSAVPLPAGGLLLLSGLAGVAAFKRRRPNKA